MEYKTTEEIVLAAQTVRHGCAIGTIRYPVLFKKAVCVFLEETLISKHALAIKMGVKVQTIRNWLIQYKEGLLTIEGACSVSPRAKSINVNLLAQLQKESKEIQIKIDLIIKCKELGLTVS